MAQGPADPLAWFTVAAFAVAALAQWYDRDVARYLAVGAWVAFAAFWLVLVPHFAFAQQSIVEGVLSALAVPGCLYAAYLLYRGRESLLVGTRAVAVMGLIYLPFTALPWLARPLVEVTTRQIEFGIGALGYEPAVVSDPDPGSDWRNTFVFETGGYVYRTSIVLACTGLGSITIFVGLIAAVRAPLLRKLRALAIAVPVIWALNLVRNVFIALAQGKQWFRDLYPEVVMTLFGETNPHLVSFLWADRVAAQSLSVVALVAITWLVVRELPELTSVFEDVVFMATGREYDLQQELGVGMRADGGDPE